MSAAQTEARPYLRHAQLFGVHQVFETALRDSDVGWEGLAHIVKGLRKIQTTRRKDWTYGVPQTFDRKGRKGAAPEVWQAPKGILDGEHRRAFVRVLIRQGCTDAKIRDFIGAPRDYVQALRAELDREAAAECDLATGVGRSIAPPARTCEITSMPSSPSSPPVGALDGAAWPLSSKPSIHAAQEAATMQNLPNPSGPPLPKFRVEVPGSLSLSGGGLQLPQTFEVHAVSPTAAKARVRQDLGLKRLPNGVTVSEIEAAPEQEPTATPEPEGVVETAVQETAAKAEKAEKAPSWKELPDAEKAEFLLGKTTIPDRAWTEEQRLPKEKRAAFIRRVLLGETDGE